MTIMQYAYQENKDKTRDTSSKKKEPIVPVGARDIGIYEAMSSPNIRPPGAPLVIVNSISGSPVVSVFVARPGAVLDGGGDARRWRKEEREDNAAAAAAAAVCVEGPSRLHHPARLLGSRPVRAVRSVAR
ncbi:hypothetical protein GWI33_022138 [Rhynchophorus ferrugineus]|uniref:Uncharacterized protein n=1 Tax=Rhynchophorus ferrugineus TaxID=354439 RepID=A0A834IUV5_RHYFE|nr:hypothetical protein GWI33_022138 [Rhynchophorus ferrugineus]